LWRQIDPQELDAGWDAVAPRLMAAVSAQQSIAAAQADRYMADVAGWYDEAPGPKVVAAAFAGVTLDGRELGPAMFGAVTTTKEFTPKVGAIRAFEIGASFLATVVGAAVQDMGRQSDMVAASGKHYTRYIRVVNAGACSRCAILAGKSSYKVAFRRHPRCRCTTFPIKIVDGVEQNYPAGNIYGSPTDYFNSLSASEQERVFTKAGAKSIRDGGADPIKVVNARRGAYGIGYSGHYGTFISESGMRRLQARTIGVKPDGTPLRVYSTTEGTSRRGSFGRSEIAASGDAYRDGRYRRSTTIRLMPEQILVMAGDDTTRLVELLRRYGYLY
jgi:hypothetical protein